MQRTTIAVPPHVRDRLQSYGRKGMTYAEILQRLMDAVDPRDLEQTGPPLYARPMSEAELESWRRKTPTQKLELAERMRHFGEGARRQAARRR